MGQNQSTAVEEPYHKRHYIETNRQIQRQNSISLTSPNLLQGPGGNVLRDYALKRAATTSIQSTSTVNFQSGVKGPTTSTTTTTSGTTPADPNSHGSAEGVDAPKPFIRLLPIEIPQPVYFDESSASEDSDYDEGDSDTLDFDHHNHHNHHYNRNNDSEYGDDDDDLVEHVFDRGGLASSPSYLDGALSVNSRLGREQADYRRSKEEAEEDFSYLSPVSGTRRFSKPEYSLGGLRSEPYYPSHHHQHHLDDHEHNHNNDNLTDASSDDEAYNEELFLKRYQLCDLPSHPPPPTTVSSSQSHATLQDPSDSLITQLDIKSPLLLDAIREEDDEESGIPSSKRSVSVFCPPKEAAGGQQQQEKSVGELYEEVRTDLDRRLQEAVYQVEQSLSHRVQQLEHGVNTATMSAATPTATTTATVTATLSPAAFAPPALAPRPPASTRSDGDVVVVLQEFEEEQEAGVRTVARQSYHTQQGSTTLRKEMLSNVSQKVGDLDSRVNQMEALVSYKLTDIESKVQELHEGRGAIAQDVQQVADLQETTITTTNIDTDPLATSESQRPLSFAEGEQPDATSTNTITTNTIATNTTPRNSQLVDKASIMELRLELQAFGMRFHELNDGLLTDLMTQMRQAKLMLFESTIDPLDQRLGRRVDKVEAEMHAKLLVDIESRIQERVLAMEQTSARLERCFDKMEGRLGALESVLAGGVGVRRPRPESMYKVLQQQQQLQLQQQQQQHEQEQHLQLQQQQGRRLSNGSDSSPESPMPDKHTDFSLQSSSCTNLGLSSHTSALTTSLNNQYNQQQTPGTGPTGGSAPQYPRATRPTRILTTSLHNNLSPLPHLLQQRTAPIMPLSAGPTTGFSNTRNHHLERPRALTLETFHGNNSNNISGSGSGPASASAHPLSSSLPSAKHHLLSQRSMTSLMAGPINGGPKSALVYSSSSNNRAVKEGAGAAASGAKVIRRPSSYKELLHFWKAGGSTPDLLNSGAGNA
ncbi:hypothetical protein BGX23_006550 [Mortierella sp. AD031]|nr:hypothetical protein BGX23_006550 [Mortierella sp. AD031]